MTKQFLLILLFSYAMLFTALSATGVETSVSSKEVVIGNPVQLKIKASGNRTAFPNIEMVGDAKVLGSSQRQHNSIIQINNQRTNSHFTTLVVTFEPKHNMTIPSYVVNIDGVEYKTDPIEIKVVKSNAPTSVSNGDPFTLTLKIDRHSVVAGEPLMATVFFSLKDGVRLSRNPEYNQPDFSGFFVKELENQKVYRKDGYQVNELVYMLTPKAEGNLTVGPATAKIAVSDGSRRDMFGRYFGTKWKSITSNIVDVEVKSKPDDVDLLGKFTIEGSVDKNQTKVNKPVNLTVTIEGEGSLEEFEFPEYESDDIAVYSDEAKVTTEIRDGKLYSKYVKKFVFISDHDFTIPSKNISVYDVENSKIKTLEMPEYDISVKGKSMVSTSSGALPDPKGIVQTNIEQEEKKKPRLPQNENVRFSWLTTLGAFLAGALLMYLLKFLPAILKSRKKSIYKESEALKILYAHINDSKEVEDMVRKLYARERGNKNIIIDKKVLKEMVERYVGNLS